MSTQVSSPLLAAANGQVAAHTPVWFMRQAGRSLPEYRAIRGEGSILDAIARPDLAAEITLQPVRRYGVDAAVLFSDIVVPAHAAGFGIDVTPGTGPVAVDPLRDRADLDRLRPLRPDDVAHVAETVKIVAGELGADVPVLAFAGAPFTVASYLIEGRPSRTYEHTKALARTDATLWHDVMDAAGVDGRDVHRRPAVGRSAGVPAVRLVGRGAGAQRLRAARAAAQPARLHRARRSPPGCARHPLRDRLRPPAGVDVGSRPTGDRSRLADLDRRRPPPSRRRRRRAGQPRPGPGAGRRRRRPRRHPRRPGRQRRPPGARVQPRPRRSPGLRPGGAGGDRRPRPRDDPRR